MANDAIKVFAPGALRSGVFHAVEGFGMAALPENNTGRAIDCLTFHLLLSKTHRNRSGHMDVCTAFRESNNA
ncbi:MAG: hypothetical protein V4661_03020 [Pseudomonadota bacterium]